MGWVIAALLTLSVAPQSEDSVLLPSRQIPVSFIIVESREPVSFDLIDYRTEQNERPRSTETERHTVFGIKRHIGVAAGYDNQTTHASVGWYITVAEWGRWNFGVPSPALGFGRYSIYNAKSKQVVATTDYSIVISLTSVHYRAGYIRSLGMNWYISVEQIFDVRSNMPGSQAGISLSRK